MAMQRAQSRLVVCFCVAGGTHARKRDCHRSRARASFFAFEIRRLLPAIANRLPKREHTPADYLTKGHTASCDKASLRGQMNVH